MPENKTPSHLGLYRADFLLGMVEILRDTLPDEPAWGELYERFATEDDDRTLVDHLEPHIRKNATDSKRTFLVDGPPEVVSIANDPHENLIEMPPPLHQSSHRG